MVNFKLILSIKTMEFNPNILFLNAKLAKIKPQSALEKHYPI